MTEYVLGFAFNRDASSVALIRKNRPEWQAGKWNGIGGHIEPNEGPYTAMLREFHEETGVEVLGWQLFVTLTDHLERWRVYFYRAYNVDLHKLRTLTDEPVQSWVTAYSTHPGMDVVPNLRWLIPFAAQDQARPGVGQGALRLVDHSGVEG